VSTSRHNYELARRLRRDMSLPERILWRHLKGKPCGLKFRKQHPVGAYVIDFYCAAAKLGIEIDGIAHDTGTRPARDCERDAAMAARGIALVHIPAGEVLSRPEEVAASILTTCRERSS